MTCGEQVSKGLNSFNRGGQGVDKNIELEIQGDSCKQKHNKYVIHQFEFRRAIK